MSSWVPLHVRSQYSILASSASVSKIALQASAHNMPAIALTDQGNLYGVVEFYKACKAAHIKPIVGCELVLAPFSRLDKRRVSGYSAGYPIVLLAKDEQGYSNLCKLSSIAHLEGFYYTPRIDKETLQKYAQGLICLSGGSRSRIGSLILHGGEEELEQEIRWHVDLFGGDFYFELGRHSMTDEQMEADGISREAWLHQKTLDFLKQEEIINQKLIEWSSKLAIPFVATNTTCYIDRSDWKAHEVLMNVQSGEACEIWEMDSSGNPKQKVPNPKREVLFSHEYYFKSPEEMQHLFADLPQALANSIEIANRCNVEIDFKTRYYPIFIPPSLEGKEYTREERLAAAEAFLKELCEEGVIRRYTSEALAKVQEKYPDQNPLTVVRERLAYELEIITSKGMCDYLLIVYDFIAWAKKQGIPMGPGRGSGAGSIILYLTGITDIEPLRFNLFFERFINPERISYPDIDVDICMDRRAEVIDYTVRKYGKDKVAQIITFGTMKAKMAIKDVGRVLSIPLTKVNAIAKLVPEDPNMTLERAFEIDAELRQMVETDEEVYQVFDLARKLEGSVRNTGIHAAGIIVSGDPLTERIPLCSSKDSDMAVTQFSMKPVEAVGMLKIDFLGLKTLTSIQKAVDAIRVNGGPSLNWIDLHLEDQATFELLNQGQTLGIFQLESGGMQDLARQLHIDKFEEIIAVGALYRPGPMEMIPSFINRKHGKEPIEIDHPEMKDILSETYGIMVYQEQVMQIASQLAGYTLGEGDVLRRAMGKKDKEEMARQRETFRLGALNHGIDEATALLIFDKVEKFASYGFNKSHAAAYGYLSYVTAFLKANHPKEWMAALMTCDRDDISKVSRIIRECQSMGIAILPPDVNESGREFSATQKGIRFALSGIKGVGEGVVEAILEQRRVKGVFRSLFDFLKRVDTRRVGKKAVEQLIDAGAFDFVGWTRPQLLYGFEPMYQTAARQQKEEEKGILNLFSHLDENLEEQFTEPTKGIPELSKLQLLKKEKELLGFYLTGHPLDQYRPLLDQLSCVELSRAEELEHDAVFRTAFIIETLQVKLSAKTQRKFAILTVSDGLERYELPIWPDLYENKNILLQEGQLLYAVLQVDKKEGATHLNCRWMDDLTVADEAMLKACDLAYDRAKMQARSFSGAREKKSHDPHKKNKDKSMSTTQKLLLQLDIEKIRLSHIAEIKKHFRSFCGNMAVDLRFYEKEKLIGSVCIESGWGVNPCLELEENLQKIHSVRSVAKETL